jgi:hypothetical protein
MNLKMHIWKKNLEPAFKEIIIPSDENNSMGKLESKFESVSGITLESVSGNDKSITKIDGFS